MMIELILIRHGQTHANVAGRWEGWSDSALTPLGRAQAEAVAHYLLAERSKVAALYTSPLHRALQTARFIGAALGLQPVSVDTLNDSVVIVAHGGTLRACLAHLLPERLGQWWNYPLDNCGLTRVSVTASNARLIVLNDNAHLPPTDNP